MKSNNKIVVHMCIVVFIFFVLIMLNSKCYAEYGTQFKKFLVMDSGTLSNGKTTATIDFDTTYEIPYSLNFDAIENYLNNNCKNKNGELDNGKIHDALEDYSLELEDEGISKAQNDEEKNNYNSLFQIIGCVKTTIVNKKSTESVQDALKRQGISSEVYNEDGTIDQENSSNAAHTKEEFLAYDYSQIYDYINNEDNVYWDGSNKRYKGIDDNSNFSESDKKEIKNKWAEVVVAQNSNDSNIKQYLSTEIVAAKSEDFYRDPEVSTSTSDGGIDDVLNDGESFINSGNEEKINITELQSFSKNIYNILFTIGIVVAVITGIVIGIKYMLGSVEEKADIKGLLIPYIVGCIIIFGAFAIWKLVVDILQGI